MILISNICILILAILAMLAVAFLITSVIDGVARAASLYTTNLISFGIMIILSTLLILAFIPKWYIELF